VGTVAPDFETQAGLNECFASALAHVAANDTPLIDERAATRGNRKGRWSGTHYAFPAPPFRSAEWHVGTVAPDFETQGGLDERFASALAHVAANDTPLIDRRAATRGRGATDGGDERTGARSALLVGVQPRERPRRATRPGARTLVDDLLRRRQQCAAQSANAPQRAGASQSKVAMRAPVRESYQFERQPREPDRRRDMLGGRSTDPAPETQHPT
jgi:hypothetical protein